jgi:hypothetical protein
MLDLHYEFKNVSAQTAAEAHENLLFFTDIKRGSLLGVEWATGYVVSAAFLEGNVFGYKRYDIDCASHLIQNAIFVEGHKNSRRFFQV